MSIQWGLCPESARKGLRAYVEEGRPPSEFLQAVLANDLQGAIRHASVTDSVNLSAVCTFVLNFFPGSWGSRVTVKRYLDQAKYKPCEYCDGMKIHATNCPFRTAMPT